jgi:hypothetical protein
VQKWWLNPTVGLSSTSYAGLIVTRQRVHGVAVTRHSVTRVEGGVRMLRPSLADRAELRAGGAAVGEGAAPRRARHPRGRQ